MKNHRGLLALSCVVALLASVSCRRQVPTAAEEAVSQAQNQFIHAIFRQESNEQVALRLMALRYGISVSNATMIRDLLFPASTIFSTAMTSTSLPQLATLSNAVLRPFDSRVSNAVAATGLTPVQVSEIGLELLRVARRNDTP